MPSAPRPGAITLALLAAAGCAAHPSPMTRDPIVHAAEVRAVRETQPTPHVDPPAPPEVAADGSRCLGPEPAGACFEACWKDDAGACASLVQACEEGDGNACSFAAHYFVAHDRRPAIDPRRIVRFLDTACTTGVVASCIWLARLYTDGESGVEKDAACAEAANRRAVEHARIGCEKNVANACMSLGSFAEHGLGTDENAAASRRAFAKAFALETAACRLGNGLSCHMLGVYYLDGTGTPVDRQKARTLLERACALPWKSSAASCSTLEQAFGSLRLQPDGRAHFTVDDAP